MMRLRAAVFLLAAVLTLAGAGTAEAKKVNIEWKEIANAASYELRLERDGRVIGVKKILDDTDWSGDLLPGHYTYQIRAVDKFKRPGRWSAARSLAVLPERPKEPLVSIEDGGVIGLYEDAKTIPLKWKPVEGITKFRVIVKHDGKTVFDRELAATEMMLPVEGDGEFSFTVAGVVEAGGVPARRWEGERSRPQEFEVKRRTLAAPVIVAPVGSVSPGPAQSTLFEWGAIEGAQAYEIELKREDPPGRMPASAVTRTFRFTKASAVLRLPNGRYSWKVRAIASTASGPQSVAGFKLDPQNEYFEGSGYVAVSGMLAPYTYKITSPATNIKGSASSFATTARVSGEYYFHPNWGLGLGFDGTMFTISGANYFRKNIEALVKYRFNLTSGALPWSMALKAGVEFRDYFEIFPTSVSRVIAGAPSISPMVSGPAVGVDLRKQFTKNFSLGVKTGYFMPVMLLSDYVSKIVMGGESLRNINFGAQGLYWLGGGWAVAFGGYFELRSIEFGQLNTKGSAISSGNEKVSMDGAYFFGSLIYSFGK